MYNMPPHFFGKMPQTPRGPWAKKWMDTNFYWVLTMFDHTPKLQSSPDRANSNQIGDLLSFSHMSEFDNNWYPFTLWPKVPYGVWGIFQKNWAGLVYKGFVQFSSFFHLMCLWWWGYSIGMVIISTYLTPSGMSMVVWSCPTGGGSDLSVFDGGPSTPLKFIWIIIWS